MTLSLAARDARTRFRMGEQIDVELRFQASAPGQYGLAETGIDRRFVRDPEYDRFTVEPTAGTADPLADSGTLYGGRLARMMHTTILGAAPLPIPGIVNDWVSFRRPGRYRITAESTRARDPGSNSVPLRSNSIEIEIVPPEPGWREARLKQAVAALESRRDDDAVLRAARILRFLETPEAVPPLARFFENGPQAAQQDLRAGLLASPHRDAVIAAMEQAVTAPDMPITYYYLGTLMQIEYSRRFGPRGSESEYQQRFKPIGEHYRAMLEAALPRKRGRARALTLEALFASQTQPSPELRKAIVDGFTTFPDDLQWRLLSQWDRIAGPDLAPALRAVASEPGQARETALEHLLEIDPQAARTIILDRIRSGDLGNPRSTEPRAFLFLPDRTLPELDSALVAALDAGPIGATLVARYASPAALPGVRAWLRRNPQAPCQTPISAYLFRVDPAYALEPGCGLQIPQYAARLLMTPALERAAIARLASPDPLARRTAQTILQYGASPAAEQPLWEALARLRGRQLTPLEQSLEFGFVEALEKGYGWVLPPEKLDALERACVTANCRTHLRSERGWFGPPVRITVLPEGPWTVMLGPTLTYTREQTREKLGQFPQGAAFALPAPHANWYWQNRLRELREILAAAGMRAVP